MDCESKRRAKYLGKVVSPKEHRGVEFAERKQAAKRRIWAAIEKHGRRFAFNCRCERPGCPFIGSPVAHIDGSEPREKQLY